MLQKGCTSHVCHAMVHSFHFFQTGKCVLLALMSVLAQTLLALVRGHLVTLLLLSVRHNCKCLLENNLNVSLIVRYYNAIHSLNEAFGGLEGR